MAKKPRNGKHVRQKGNRFEAECVALLRAAGLTARRIPLSGAAGGEFSGDVQATIKGQVRKFECKHRKSISKFLYEWLDGNYALIVRRDHTSPLVVLPFDEFMALVSEW